MLCVLFTTVTLHFTPSVRSNLAGRSSPGRTASGRMTDTVTDSGDSVWAHSSSSTTGLTTVVVLDSGLTMDSLAAHRDGFLLVPWIVLQVAFWRSVSRSSRRRLPSMLLVSEWVSLVTPPRQPASVRPSLSRGLRDRSSPERSKQCPSPLDTLSRWTWGAQKDCRVHRWTLSRWILREVRSSRRHRVQGDPPVRWTEEFQSIFDWQCQWWCPVEHRLRTSVSTTTLTCPYFFSRLSASTLVGTLTADNHR